MKSHKLIYLLPIMLNGCAVVAEYPITSASLAIWGATGKGPVDHAVSNMVHSDCKSTRMLDLQAPCQDVVHVPAPVEDRSFYKPRKVAKM